MQTCHGSVLRKAHRVVQRSSRRLWNRRKTSTLQGSTRSEWMPSTSSLPLQSWPERNVEPMNGDLVATVFSMRATTSQNASVRVKRVWRSHLSAKEMEIGCSTLFDMRGNTLADEMAGRAATRAEVLTCQADAVQAMDGMAWHVRMRIIEANFAGLICPGPSVSSYHRVHQATEKRDSRKGMSCLKP